jgi:hypothetical protein
VRGPASGAKEEREFPQDPPGVLPGDERLTGRVLTLPGALRNPLQANGGISASLAWALGPAPPTAQTLNHPQVLDLKRTSRANPPLQRPVARRPRPPQNPPSCSTLYKWRDPDSNRGHHDFQSCDRKW